MKIAHFGEYVPIVVLAANEVDLCQNPRFQLKAGPIYAFDEIEAMGLGL
jgi:hypothetical protein